MGISIQRTWRDRSIIVALFVMLAGLFFSRALLSIGMISFLALTLLHHTAVQQLKIFLHNKLLVGLSFLFLISFASGLWSANKNDWMEVVRIKLPLLLMPLAFAGGWQLSPKGWKAVFYFFLLLCFGGCCWSLWQYGQNLQAINESYLRAKSIPTPLEDDHVRFSWLVAVAASLCLYASLFVKSQRWLLSLACLIFVAYLHVLSARTGLLCFYFFALVLMVYLLFFTRRKKWWPLLLLLLPLLAWLLLPTFRNRLAYIAYDLSFIKSKTYLPGGNDGNRVQSIKAGWSILKQHPLGVGAGDVRDETFNWYATHLPGMLPTDRLLPSSEWLMYGAAAGWPGLIFFIAIMLLPLFLRVPQHRLAWMALNAMAALSFLFDIGLEVQFGVFAYIFVILCGWKFSHLPKQLPLSS